MATLPPQLRATLHPGWLRRLRQDWTNANVQQLNSELKLPVLCIDTGAQVRLGQWQPRGRVMSISESHILAQSWFEVVDTLRHEIAHQYVSEVLRVTDETAHGAAFAQTCARLNIEACAKASYSAQDRENVDRVLLKVQRLLALAESDNVHEAEAAMAAANRLLLEYNLEAQAAKSKSNYGFRRLGKPAAALPIETKLIGGILSQFFFVECIWVTCYNALLNRDERVLEIMGDPTNLELASYVHDFLHGAVERHWNVAKLKLGRADISTRREFKGGLLTGFSHKLREERAGQAQRGLVWVGDPALRGYYRQRHPSVSSMSSSGWHHSEAHQAGQAAGRSLQIHHGVTHQGRGGGLLAGS